VNPGRQISPEEQYQLGLARAMRDGMNKAQNGDFTKIEKVKKHIEDYPADYGEETKKSFENFYKNLPTVVQS